MEKAVLKVFLLKVKARCNINCTYCYEYNLADTTWRASPSTMSRRTLKASIERISNYVKEHNLKKITVIFHGGEVLLAPRDLFVYAVRLFNELLQDRCEVSFGSQTNGTLIDEDWLNLFQDLKIHIGLSIDGTREANDKFRLDFKGRSTFDATLKGLKLLNQDRYNQINGSVLTVINPENHPLETYSFLGSIGAKRIDFLFPHYNYESLPPFTDTAIGTWLTTIFDEWWHNAAPIQIRLFEHAIHLMLGGYYSVENLGLCPVEMIVIQTNGSYEAVDSLKSTFDGAVSTGKNVFDNAFDEVLDHPLIGSRLNRADTLPSQCKKCRIVKVCGGGYLPHRFDPSNGFDNPSIFCKDLIMLIEHIEKALKSEDVELGNIIDSVLKPII